jgi:hypothetical protein
LRKIVEPTNLTLRPLGLRTNSPEEKNKKGNENKFWGYFAIIKDLDGRKIELKKKPASDIKTPHDSAA